MNNREKRKEPHLINTVLIWDMTLRLIAFICQIWYSNFQWHMTREAFVLFAFLIAEGMLHTQRKTSICFNCLEWGCLEVYL